MSDGFYYHAWLEPRPGGILKLSEVPAELPTRPAPNHPLQVILDMLVQYNPRVLGNSVA